MCRCIYFGGPGNGNCGDHLWYECSERFAAKPLAMQCEIWGIWGFVVHQVLGLHAVLVFR